MALSCPPWPVFLIHFAQNLQWECKQLRDADGHSRVNTRCQPSDEINFWNDVLIKFWNFCCCCCLSNIYTFSFALQHPRLTSPKKNVTRVLREMILTLVYFIDFTDNLQYSSGFRHTLNQSSMVYGNWLIIWQIKSSGNTINSIKC